MWHFRPDHQGNTQYQKLLPTALLADKIITSRHETAPVKLWRVNNALRALLPSSALVTPAYSLLLLFPHLPPPPQTTKPPDDKPATSPADPEHPRLPPVQIYNSVNGERPAIISTGDVGGALLLGAAINWGQGLGWSWAPSQCRAPHHCCCCDTAPHQHDVSHNQCCGCDTAPHQHDVTQNQCCCCDTVNCDTHTVAHHHDILYDTCNGFDDVDYSMDCSGDFGF
ncbi:hypothetical protein J6590_049204 [Homalodisca vitripennis]|nr:hypothetical protein J6590_049204 [Homalodisca vitripennis]